MSDVAVRPKRLETWGWCLGLAWLALAVFAPAVGFDYVDLDDPQYVFANPHVISGLSWSHIRWAFTTIHESWWLPVLWISYMMDATLFGLEPWGFHLSNVLLHAANAGLLFWVLRRATKSTRPSVFAAALFALHPLRVESVAWITERKDVLSGLFWMLALAVHLRQAEKPSAGKTGLLVLLMTLGLMSKASVVALPAALLLLDYWPLGRLRTRAGWRICLREKAALFALAAVFAAITLATHVSTGGQYSAVSGWQRLSLVPGNYYPYLAKFFWPARLSIYYPENDVVRWGWFALAAAGLVAVTVLSWRLRRRTPALLMGWLWFLVAALPVIRGVRIGIADYANRFIYLPSIGLSIAVAWGFAACLPPWPGGRRWLPGMAALALGACAALTVHNLRFWRDSDTLFQRAWELDPTNYLGITGRGVALQKAERWEEARAHFEQAAAAAPRVVRYQVNLALALLNMDRPAEAMSVLEKARRRAPAAPEFDYALGLVHLHAGRPDQARIPLSRAAPGMKHLEAMCRTELACACFEDGDSAAANEQLELANGAAFATPRTYADLLPHYAWVWDSGERPRALRYFRKLAAENAANPAILNNVAWLLAVTDPSPAPPNEALALAQRAVETGGQDRPILLDTLAAACAHAGLYAEATAQATRARELATAQGQDKLARRLARRIEQYRRNKPWREKKVS